ncbi:hypothetical protein JVU11DRAFT_9233 [Chiua virens]|nr:hypothetical protein JVU11DRAFT_9233 [Chiua virens]
MDFRAELKWISHEMTPKRESGKSPVVLKHPQALSDKLGEIESKVMARIVKGDFRSKRTHTEDFWRKHCFIVLLIKPETEGETKTIMYPGGMGGASLNHRKGYCSDAVNVLKSDGAVLPWPKPQGIFTPGRTFHPQVFCATIQDIYERYCATAEPPPIASNEVVAFITLLSSRLRTFDNGMLDSKQL